MIFRMRVISGSRRGRKLISFEGTDIRPTTDRVKESIFNLIAGYVAGSRVLDLFGGSGALSIEALSRGAEYAVIVDSSIKSMELIKKNIELTDFSDKTKTVVSTAEKFVSENKNSFDVIFLDPPYNKGFVIPVLTAVSERGILSEDGIAVLESDFRDDHGEIEGLEILKQRKYGRTYITVYKRKSGKDVD